MIFWHRLRAAVEGAFNHRDPVIVEIGGGRPNDPGFAATESGVIAVNSYRPHRPDIVALLPNRNSALVDRPGGPLFEGDYSGVALPFRTGVVDELRLAGLPLTIVDDAALREVNRVMKRGALLKVRGACYRGSLGVICSSSDFSQCGFIHQPDLVLGTGDYDIKLGWGVYKKMWDV